MLREQKLVPGTLRWRRFQAVITLAQEFMYCCALQHIEQHVRDDRQPDRTRDNVKDAEGKSDQTRPQGTSRTLVTVRETECNG